MGTVIANIGVLLIPLGMLICFLNSGGLVIFLKLRALKLYGVEGEAIPTLDEWISKGRRVYYDVLIPGGDPMRPPRFIEIGRDPAGPVGSIVPVVYDRRKPKRARTGTLDEIDFADEWDGVKAFWGTGLAVMALGALLVLVFH
ncbi:hypothetical protein ACN2WE_00120 [Streptomyces sp. cg28]|uniref:hypothetical protein n=1 Tax=Streptomyces sp. cg28 TaxID=3403457 RepID=UPI003B217E66